MSWVNIFTLNRARRMFVVSRKYCSHQNVDQLLQNNNNGSMATVKGWVRSIRKMKGNIFVDLDDGSCGQRLQVVMSKDVAPAIDYGSSIEVKGELNRAPSGQLEVNAKEVAIIGFGGLEDGYPFAPRKSYSPDYCRQYLHLRPRIAHYASLLRVRDCLSFNIRDYFREESYFEVHTPVLTSNDCEGAGEVFKVISDETLATAKNNKVDPFFGSNTFLTVSAQLHLEVLARSLSQVYCFGPTFRAENSKSRFHVAEFYMLEAETTQVTSVENLIGLVEKLLRQIITNAVTKNGRDVELSRKNFSNSEYKLEDCLTKPWTIMSYDEASRILCQNSNSLNVAHEQNTALTKEHELFLTNYTNGPIFIIHWPASIKPFYMKINTNQPGIVEAFDLLLPNVGEVCGGSLREDDYDRLKEVLGKHKGLEWYLDLRKFGNVLTGGFGLGFDRLLMALLNVSNIKDCVPFPRYPHHCQL